MRQQDGFSHEDGYRASSPNNQLPSLHEQLLRHRQDDMDVRPSLRHADDGSVTSDPWVGSQPTVDPFVPGVFDTLPPSQPSPSWSDDSSTFSDPSPRNGGDADPKRKRPRFLGDIDRRIIIQRLENGEKQADLAREFGVTRAAVCHINKNREEILTRFDILAKSPQGRQMIQNYVHAPHVASLVRELRTPNVSVLLTRLRGGNTSQAVFKSTADRLMSILIEEALVSFGTRAVGVQDLLGSNYDGKEYARPAFALSVSEEGGSFLKVFTAMEPASYRGFIVLENLDGGRVVRHIDLPPNASESNAIVCLTSLNDIDTMRAALKALETRGVKTSRLCIVCVTAAEACINQLATEFRETKILTACITKGTEHALDSFVSRWTASLSQ